MLSGCLHAWAADFLRGLRLHEENAGSPQTAPAAAEAVRRLRTAARRIGSTLHTYRPLVDAAWADELSAELRRLSGALAREYRVEARRERLLAALHRLPVEGTGGDRAAALLERQHTLARSRAHSAALEVLASSRFHAVADAVAVLAYEVPLASGAPRGRAGAILVPLAERARERLAGAVEALSPSSGMPTAPDGRPAGGHGGSQLARPDARPPGRRYGWGARDAQGRQDAAWLEARVLLRHHRYAQEVLRSAAAPPPADCREGDGEAKAGQRGGHGTGRAAGGACVRRDGAERLGADGPFPQLAAAGDALDRLRDAVEAAEAAASAARTPRIAPATAYALGVLHAGQQQEAERARLDFREMWERVQQAERTERAD